MYERKRYSHLVNYIPGFVTLIFGMLALHSAVSLTHAREVGIGNLHQKEMILYWSIIAVGLSSFVLIVLHTYKTAELKRINYEKKQGLELLENRLAALEMAQDGILIIDHTENLTYMNTSLCQIVGIDTTKRDIYTNKPWKDIFSRSDKEMIEEDILPELQSDGHWMGDFPIYREDNSVVYTELSLTQLPDGGMIATIQDVSAKQKAESEKKALEEQFYQAQKMEAVGRLAGGVAHDFNNILAAMNGYAEFLIDDLDEDTEQHNFANNILQAGIQARDLVDQMLAFSRQSDSAQENLDLLVAVNETVSMLRATMPKTVELQETYSVPYAPMVGNATQISQLVMNLCVNAQDSMEEKHGYLVLDVDAVYAKDLKEQMDIVRDNLPDPSETPHLRIEDLEAGTTRLTLGHIAKEQKYARLRVKDTGSGMSRVIMEHIFEPFFTTKPVDKGTGLGLATVHGVIVSHKGAMVIESKLGSGTCFDLYFPLSEDVAIIGVKPNENDFKQGEMPERKNILLVEDQENVRDMVITMLERMGYDVSFAVSGLDGLDIVREAPDKFDLVITDHNMPKMTGLEMVQQIHIDLPELPFILLSGYSEDKLQDIINDHPAIKMVVRKPVSGDILGKKIQAVIGMAA